MTEVEQAKLLRALRARCRKLEAALQASSDIMRETVRGFVAPARVIARTEANDALIAKGSRS